MKPSVRTFVFVPAVVLGLAALTTLSAVSPSEGPTPRAASLRGPSTGPMRRSGQGVGQRMTPKVLQPTGGAPFDLRSFTTPVKTDSRGEIRTDFDSAQDFADLSPYQRSLQ